MPTNLGSFHQLATNTKWFVRRLAIIGQNRLELLAVEMQEGRERVLHAVLLALGVAAFGLLAGITLTAAVADLLWAYSPLAVLLTLTGVYGAAGFYLYRRLIGLLENWHTLSATLDQIQKDRACMEKFLA